MGTHKVERRPAHCLIASITTIELSSLYSGGSIKSGTHQSHPLTVLSNGVPLSGMRPQIASSNTLTRQLAAIPGIGRLICAGIQNDLPTAICLLSPDRDVAPRRVDRISVRVFAVPLKMTPRVTDIA